MMKYENFEFIVYRNRHPPYLWLFTIVDTDTQTKYESKYFYRKERDAVTAVFECMRDCKNNKIDLQDKASFSVGSL